MFPLRSPEKLLDVLWKQNDLAAARIVFKSVLAVTPQTAVDSPRGIEGNGRA